MKMGRNTFLKYKQERKICLPYMIQTGFCKIGEKNLIENFKSHLRRSSCVANCFKRFNFFTGTFNGFCHNIPELALRDVQLSVTLAEIYGYFSQGFNNFSWQEYTKQRVCRCYKQ